MVRESAEKCGQVALVAAYKSFSRRTPYRRPRGSHASNLRLFGSMAGPLMRLVAEDIACQRGGREVFTGLSFAVDKGEALLVTGRNGAGKSSLLRIIAGLVRLAAGRLTLQGGNAESNIAEQAHYVGHQDPVKGALSVAENLTFWSSYLGGKPDIRTALKTVGLDGLADLPAAYLSAGQRRRLSIARLVAVKRPLWLLDEPT